MPPADTDPKTGRLKHDGRVTFGFLEDITTPDCDMTPSCRNYRFKNLKNVPWYAELTLKVNDVAALLKNGLFWSEDNIDSTDNFFVDGNNAPHPGSAWIYPLHRHGRYYKLIDTESAQWHGTLMVRAHTMSMLRQFRPRQLSLANVRFVSAKNPQGRAVYHFDSVESDRCFNAILDDTPLEGWWPWPKKEDMDANTMQSAMDDDLTQEDIDDDSMQEDIDAGSMQEDNDDASNQEDTDNDSMQDDSDEATKQEDTDNDSMQEDTDNDSTLEDTDDDLSDQQGPK
ncbi:hypothetical protein MY1884_000611 [Beauveria asiatica]